MVMENVTDSSVGTNYRTIVRRCWVQYIHKYVYMYRWVRETNVVGALPSSSFLVAAGGATTSLQQWHHAHSTTTTTTTTTTFFRGGSPHAHGPFACQNCPA